MRRPPSGATAAGTTEDSRVAPGATSAQAIDRPPRRSADARPRRFGLPVPRPSARGAAVAALVLVLALVAGAPVGPSVAQAQSQPQSQSLLAQEPRPAAVERTMRVGPQREVATLAAAARLAGDNTLIEVDAGTYRGDVAVWTQSGLTLRAIGGRVHLLADGRVAEGKGIWVVRSRGTVTVEGFDFEGAVAESHNGAGIRFEGGRLVIRDCAFTRNETGVLTSNDGRSVLEVESSEFSHNVRPDGQSHLLYVGSIARFAVTGSYFHHASVGHLLKSRAAHNSVFYNRLTDEGGSASYELEFPNGGVAVVVGNVIRQSASTDNPAIVSFGAEGYPRPANELHLAHNTIVDDAPRGGPFVRVWPGGGASVRAFGNLHAGNGAFTDAASAELSHNFRATAEDFVALDRHDYRLQPGSALRGRVAGAAYLRAAPELLPTRQYAHPRRTVPLDAPPVDPGAVQRTGRAAGA